MRRKIDRLEERLGGIRNMKGLPELVFVVDVRREETAIHEANLLKIPVIALVDTNCDPSGVDYVIPSNDDAIRAIKLLTATVADIVLEGKAMRKDEEEYEVAEGVPEEAVELELSDEELLGEATLAKLQSGEYDERSRSEAVDEIEGEVEEISEETGERETGEAVLESESDSEEAEEELKPSGEEEPDVVSEDEASIERETSAELEVESSENEGTEEEE
jgi:small subunit ribosomal protein S2